MFHKIIGLKLFLISFVIFLSFSCTADQQESHPRNIRFTSTRNPNEGLTLIWQNVGEIPDEIKWGYTSSYEQGTFDPLKHYKMDEGFRYDYTFPALKPNTTIHYAIYDGSRREWSEDKTYTTASPVASDEFSFTVLGDSRTQMDQWQKVANAVPASDFSLFLGDLVNDGNIAENWEEWYRKGRSYNEKNCVYHCYGNHDGSVENYKRQFMLPSNRVNGSELYYSFTFGNAVFICLDSEHPGDTAQYNWLQHTLDRYKNKTWTFVFFHRPFYSCSEHAGEMDEYFNTWWKTFDQYGVDMIFNGHDHNYQRSKPINRNISVNQPVETYGSDSGEGRCQVISGGAGAPLYDVDKNKWMEKVKAQYHYCHIKVIGDSLAFTVKKPNQQVMDQFTLTK